jgi:hypothetical protein
MLKICGKKILSKNGITKSFQYSITIQDVQQCVFFVFIKRYFKKNSKILYATKKLLIFATDWLLIKTNQK